MENRSAYLFKKYFKHFAWQYLHDIIYQNNRYDFDAFIDILTFFKFVTENISYAQICFKLFENIYKIYR